MPSSKRSERERPSEIAYVLRYFPRLSGTFVLNELRELERQGVRPRIFSLYTPPDRIVHEGAEPFLARTVTLDRLPRVTRLLGVARLVLRHPLRVARALALVRRRPDPRLRVSLRLACALAAEVERRGIRHLHSHFGLGSDVAFFVSMLTGASFSFTLHARDLLVRPRLLPEKLARARFAVTVCEANREILLANAPRGQAEVHVLRPVLDLALFTPDPARAPNPDSVIRIATVARLVEKKGIPFLLDALAELAKGGLAFRAVIAGDGPERRSLEARVSALGLAEAVALVGALRADAVRDLLARSDLFVLPCVPAADGDRDATPTVLGEAMAMGLPVVSTTVGGIPEVVPTSAGTLVPPGDSHALAEAIASLAGAGPDGRRAMGAQGRAFVRTHWSASRDVAKLAELLREAVADR